MGEETLSSCTWMLNKQGCTCPHAVHGESCAWDGCRNSLGDSINQIAAQLTVSKYLILSSHRSKEL